MLEAIYKKPKYKLGDIVLLDKKIVCKVIGSDGLVPVTYLLKSNGKVAKRWIEENRIKKTRRKYL
jgi:hypothetical protein